MRRPYSALISACLPARKAADSSHALRWASMACVASATILSLLSMNSRMRATFAARVFWASAVFAHCSAMSALTTDSDSSISEPRARFSAVLSIAMFSILSS